MKISPFQALTILANYYKDNPQEINKYHQICSLYLTGAKSTSDHELLERLLQDNALKGYTISDDKETIHRDPVRRYFESHLSAETLKISLDKLDIKKLEDHFNGVFHEIPFYARIFVPKMIYRGSPNDFTTKLSETAAEYISAIQLISSGENFKFLDLENNDGNLRKSKMLFLVKTAHAAMSADSLRSKKYYALNLKDNADSSYHANNRGRQTLVDEQGRPQQVKSSHLGIMRDYMPLPNEDVLSSEAPATYIRPTDKSTYVLGAQAPEQSFNAKLLPFVNSVSGLMLAQLRIISKLVDDKKFPYHHDSEQLKEFFKCFVSFMLFNSGGHALNEFLQVLQDPAVQNKFKDVAGFEQCHIKTLFQDENQVAFEEALMKTIKYNQQILARVAVQDEIKAKVIPVEKRGQHLMNRFRQDENPVSSSTVATDLEAKTSSEIDKSKPRNK